MRLIQVGRTLWVLLALGRRHPLVPNFRRILAWTCVAARALDRRRVADGNAAPGARGSPACCASTSRRWSASVSRASGRSSDQPTGPSTAAHLAERCQLFVIVALGESILASGVAFGQPRAMALRRRCWRFLVGFLGSLAMWWMYFDTSSKDAAHVIEHSADPGPHRRQLPLHARDPGGRHHRLGRGRRAGRSADGGHHAEWKYLGALLGGPAIYLFGNALFKRVVYGFVPQSHIGGLVAAGAARAVART